MTENKPTHWHEKSQAAVFPEGYDAKELTKLAPDFWDKAVKAEAVQAIKAQAAQDIAALDFPLHKQLNAIREGRLDDPLFAQIDAIRARSNEEERKLP